MPLCRYTDDRGDAAFALYQPGQICPLAELIDDSPSEAELFDRGSDWAAALPQPEPSQWREAPAQLLPPTPTPEKIFCIGLNGSLLQPAGPTPAAKTRVGSIQRGGRIGCDDCRPVSIALQTQRQTRLMDNGGLKVRGAKPPLSGRPKTASQFRTPRSTVCLPASLRPLTPAIRSRPSSMIPDAFLLSFFSCLPPVAWDLKK